MALSYFNGYSWGILGFVGNNGNTEPTIWEMGSVQRWVVFSNVWHLCGESDEKPSTYSYGAPRSHPFEVQSIFFSQTQVSFVTLFLQLSRSIPVNLICFRQIPFDIEHGNGSSTHVEAFPIKPH